MENALKKIREYWWIGILLVLAPCLIKARIPDPDTFFLAATGRYIVETGVVPTVNPFVIHEGFGVIIQQWLFDVLIYGAYSTLGNTGLFLFVITAFAISVVLMYKYFGLFTDNKTLKSIVLIASALLYIAYGVARPTSISFIVMLSLLYCMEQYRRTGKKICLGVLPVLSLIEINIHAAMWPMMFVLMLPYVFPYTLPKKSTIITDTKNWFNKNRYILLSAIVMFGVGFINPNGFNGMTYVIKSYGSATDGIKITELLPPATDSLCGIIIMIVVAALALYVYQNKEKLTDSQYDMQVEFTRFYMAAGVLVLACLHIRNMWYLILGATPVVLSVLDGCSFRLNKPKKEAGASKLLIQNISYIAVIGLLTYFMLSASSYASYTVNDSKYAPVKAVEYLNEQTDENVVLYTEFNNGAYLEWQGYEVYIDARPELYQAAINGKEDVYSEFCDVMNGNIDYQEFVDKYGFTHLIVSDNTLFDMYLSLNNEYRAVVDGDGYTLYELM